MVVRSRINRVPGLSPSGNHDTLRFRGAAALEMGCSEKKLPGPPAVPPIPPTAMRTRADFQNVMWQERRPDTTTLNQWVPSSSPGSQRPACGKAYFRPVFRHREGGSCVSAHRSRLLGRFWGACLRRQKSRSRSRPGVWLMHHNFWWRHDTKTHHWRSITLKASAPRMKTDQIRGPASLA
jgi:hypothetical protein